MLPCANALGVIIHNDTILVEEKHEHSKGTGYYYRPIGGTIELGEHSRETLVREYHEELGADFTIIRYICCFDPVN
ncbi:NUDIX domain-containing protein [Paenibacillus catalpae]|uniref:NUDIX domain-containing protein n=1 Tax=Paenibacillus catalpae TaxID=1045775 RepID=A0A1I2AMJ6_9BACL|nr:NUDIX domain-containing protein [Paenibacillus catalpae]SFE45255.1 NUDIX domain-containing protein [Paenibacillus catalpae]